MPVPANIAALSTTPASNSTLGSESPTTADDYMRTIFAFIAQLAAGQNYTGVLPIANGGLGAATPAQVASAATVDIGAQLSLLVEVSGATGPVTSLGTNYRGPRVVRFSGAPLLTYNATTLVLPGAANLQIAANDVAIFVPKTTAGVADGWVLAGLQRASGFYAASGLITSSGLTMNTGKMLGRTTAGVGAPEEIDPILPATATPLVASGAGNVGNSAKYARENHIHPEPTARSWQNVTASRGMGASYTAPNYDIDIAWHGGAASTGGCNVNLTVNGQVIAVSSDSANAGSGSFLYARIPANASYYTNNNAGSQNIDRWFEYR